MSKKHKATSPDLFFVGLRLRKEVVDRAEKTYRESKRLKPSEVYKMADHYRVLVDLGLTQLENNNHNER